MTQQHNLENTPAWQHMNRHQSVLSYFVDVVVHGDRDERPIENELFIQAVIAEIDNKKMAKDIVEQLCYPLMVEMGDLSGWAGQTGTLLTALLKQRHGSKYHIGLYWGKKEDRQKVSCLVNKCINGVQWGFGLGSSQMNFLALNAQTVGQRFLASCLRRSDSVWHHVVDSLQLQNKLAKSLGVDTLFNTVDGKPIAPQSLSETVMLLEEGKINPAPVLLRSALYMAHVQLIGDLQQSNESVIIKEKLGCFMDRLGQKGVMSYFKPAIDRGAVRADMCFDGCVKLQMNGCDITLEQLIQLPHSERISMMKQLPYIDSKAAVQNAIENKNALVCCWKSPICQVVLEERVLERAI